MRKIIRLLMPLLLLGLLFGCESGGSSGSDDPEKVWLSPPEISPESGTYADSVEVKINSSKSGYFVIYTTNGSAPDPEDTTTFVSYCSKTLTDPGTYNIRALMIDGNANIVSDTASATITITGDNNGDIDPPAFSFSPYSYNGSIYTEDVIVYLNASDYDHTIYYTLDGTDPTNASTEYEGTFKLCGSTTAEVSYTIKAIACDEDGQCSDVAEETITISYPILDAPSASLESGTWNKSRILFDCDYGCTIHFTTDGSDPVSDPNKTATTGESFYLDSATTLKMYASAENCRNSAVTTYEYAVDNVDVYIAGYTTDVGNEKASYWKNTVFNEYSTATEGYPQSILVSGNEVMTAGFYLNTSDNKVPCYWDKDGNRISLATSPADCEGTATSIVKAGSDIMVAGSYLSGSTPYGAYWKIAASPVLSSTAGHIYGRATVDNSIVYAAGCTASASAVAALYKDASAYGSFDAPVTFSGTHKGASDVAIDTSGTAYLSANTYSSLANMLSSITGASPLALPESISYLKITSAGIKTEMALDSSGEYIARAICCSPDGTIVIVAGVNAVESTWIPGYYNCTATIWINGNAFTLNSEVYDSDVTAIKFIGSDLYISGNYRSSSSGVTLPCYWVDKGADGIDITQYKLYNSDGTTISGGSATDITVVTL